MPPYINDFTVDIPKFQELVDYLMPRGYNYFETGHFYMDGACERAFKECVSSKYPRDSYVISNKLSYMFLDNIENTFYDQLEACGVDYFDVYLMHAQSEREYYNYKKAGAYNKILEFKKQGKIKHFGISFHDNAKALEKILLNEPEIEIVQIQFNYYDYNDPIIQSRQIYEICCKYNKKIVVMKPNRGYFLAHLPEPAHDILSQINTNNYSEASYAFRFIKGFENIWMILSCVRNLEELKDNINTMENLPLLNQLELDILEKINLIIKDNINIPCSKCNYCLFNCPCHNNIPNIITIINEQRCSGKNVKEFFTQYDKNIFNIDCKKCNQCTLSCPQKLPIMGIINLFKHLKTTI